MRLDQYLVNQSLVPSRNKAQELIKAGQVYIVRAGNSKVITSPAFKVDSNTEVRLHESNLLQFVSRGGVKLDAAIKHLNLNLEQKRCLDIGQSTGGFTDCLLQSGAREVVGIDVGSGQLHPSLQGHPQVTYFENFHAQTLLTDPFFLDHFFDFVVVDASFISLEKLLEPLMSCLNKEAEVLALVKPQFELGAEHLNKKGVVKNKDLYLSLEQKMLRLFSDYHLQVRGYFESTLLGQSGNKEFFIYAGNSETESFKV